MPRRAVLVTVTMALIQTVKLDAQKGSKDKNMDVFSGNRINTKSIHSSLFSVLGGSVTMSPYRRRMMCITTG